MTYKVSSGTLNLCSINLGCNSRHEMQTIVTDDLVVCLSRGSTRLYSAKVTERIEMLFGVNTPAGPRNIVLDVGPDLSTARGIDSMQSLPNYFGLLLKLVLLSAEHCGSRMAKWCLAG